MTWTQESDHHLRVVGDVEGGQMGGDRSCWGWLTANSTNDPAGLRLGRFSVLADVTASAPAL
jgi:hypothetical protein